MKEKLRLETECWWLDREQALLDFVGWQNLHQVFAVVFVYVVESIRNNLYVSTWTLSELHLFPHSLQNKYLIYWFVSKFFLFPKSNLFIYFFFYFNVTARKNNGFKYDFLLVH